MKIKKRESKKKTGINKTIFILFAILIVLAAAVIYSLAGHYSENNLLNSSNTNQLKEFTTPNTIIMYLPAVDNNDTGYMTTLKVEAMPGTGRTLVDIDGLLFWEDTQQSIRKAKDVAEKMSKVNTSNVDLIYTIRANASLIGGESAGAAITIATIAALENAKLNEKIIITGTINHDGTIGPVQGILPKAKAAKEFGATLFLVPLLQSQDVVYATQKHCDNVNGFDVCTTEQIPTKNNVSQEVNIEIKEVGTIQDALKYFAKD